MGNNRRYHGRHYGHLKFFDSWTNTSPGLKNDDEKKRFDKIFKELQSAEIGICMSSCPCLQKDIRCSAFGGIAPLGRECGAQVLGRVSKENSRS
jgi:hypothetical protein